MSKELQVRKGLLSLPGCSAVPMPVLGAEQRKNATEVMTSYAPLLAELALERAVNGIVTGEPEGVALVKILAPHLWKKQAQVIETRNGSGDADEKSVDSLQEYLNAERAAEAEEREAAGG